MNNKVFENLLNGERVKTNTHGTAFMCLRTSSRLKGEDLPDLIDIVESIGDAPTLREKYIEFKSIRDGKNNRSN